MLAAVSKPSQTCPNTGIPPSGRSPLMELPRELRDTIWEYALVEPPLWARAHKVGCLRIDPTLGEELPVFRSPRAEELHICDRKFSVEQGDLPEACRQLCQKRQGLALLRSNKQIYEETREIFYARNMFCFVDVTKFTAAFEALPVSAVQTIQRMSILQDYCGVDPYYCYQCHLMMNQVALWPLLKDFKALVELELPSQLIHAAEYLSRLLLVSRLQTFRMAQFSVLYKSGPSKPRAEMVMRVERKVALPSQPFPIKSLMKRDREQSPERYSVRRADALCGTLENLARTFHRVKDFGNKTATKTTVEKCLAAARREAADMVSLNGTPVDVSLTLKDGSTEQVTLLGLPRMNQRARVMHQIRTKGGSGLRTFGSALYLADYRNQHIHKHVEYPTRPEKEQRESE